MRPNAPYRVFWCVCGQKMRVSLQRLGRSGHCVKCRREITPTFDNTVLPGEGPPTPPPVRCGALARSQSARKVKGDGQALDETPAPGPPSAIPFTPIPTPEPAEPLPLFYPAHRSSEEEQNGDVDADAPPAASPRVDPAAREGTRDTGLLRRKLARLKRKRLDLCAELGAAVYEARALLPSDPKLVQAAQAVAECDRRIARYEAALAESERRPPPD